MLHPSTTGGGVEIGAAYAVTEQLASSGRFASRRGDVVSTTSQGYAIFQASNAIAADPAFGDELYAYRLRGTTNVFSLDYGTGYSSLAYLRNLPVQQLKIDKSFVMGLAADRDDEIIVRSTIELGHNMGLLVIAEGVEDEPTFERLRSLGCDMAQGYWLSRPLDAAAAETWMRDAERTAQRQERQPLRRVG